MTTPFSPNDDASRELRQRSATALNNVGVSLLQRRCYVQALEAFECAASLMPDSLVEAASAVNTNDLVQKSLQQLTSAKPARREALIIEVLSVTPEGNLTLDSDNNSSRRTVLETVLLDAPCQSVAHAVRLESHYVPKQEAVATHNLAIACLCLAKVLHTTNEKRIQMKRILLEKAALYARSASTVLLEEWNASMNALESSDSNGEEGNECQDAMDWLTYKLDSSRGKGNNGILDSITVGVLNVYLTALQENSRVEEARELYSQMVDFRESAFENNEQQCQALLQTVLRSGGSAAAA